MAHVLIELLVHFLSSKQKECINECRSLDIQHDVLIAEIHLIELYAMRYDECVSTIKLITLGMEKKKLMIEISEYSDTIANLKRIVADY